MKLLKKSFVVLLFLGLISAPAARVLGAETDYTYTVRIFSGAQGTINGEEVRVHRNLKYGQEVTFNQRDVVLKDNSKYYIKGIRESGKDNNTAVSAENGNLPSFKADGDKDYVVVYGILTNAVAYTINYQDEDGNELAPSETYYGNVGDDPVLAYLYIEGYQPQAYNLTKTLSENAADNIFTFVYTPVDTTTPTAPDGTAPTTPPGTTPTLPAGGGEEPTLPTPADAGGGTVAGAAAPDGGAAAGGGAATPTPADAGATPPGEVIPDDAVPQAPADLENLNDGEVPLSNPGGNDGSVIVSATDFATRLLNFPLAAKAGICSALVLLGGAGAWAAKNLKKRKVKND